MNVSSRIPTRGTALAATALVALCQFSAPLANATEPLYFKDLDIRQKPMAQLQSAPASAASTASTGLAVNTTVDRPDARYQHGDTLTLTVDVTEDAYVWVFDTGTSGKVHQIFPNRHETDNFVRAGSAVAIPGDGADYQLLVSHPKGAELLTVIASKDNVPLTRDLVDGDTEAGPFLALRGDAVSVAKDLKISLKAKPASRVVHSQVIHIE